MGRCCWYADCDTCHWPLKATFYFFFFPLPLAFLSHSLSNASSPRLPSPEQHAKNLAGIKAAAGSEAALADTRTKAEKKALELEALL